MKFEIRPYIHCEEPNYSTFFTEINKFSIEELESVLINIENVFSGKYEASSFSGEVVSSIEFDKENAVITYYDEVVGEESTQEIYEMLKAFRDALRGLT